MYYFCQSKQKATYVQKDGFLVQFLGRNRTINTIFRICQSLVPFPKLFGTNLSTSHKNELTNFLCNLPSSFGDHWNQTHKWTFLYTYVYIYIFYMQSYLGMECQHFREYFRHEIKIHSLFSGLKKVRIFNCWKIQNPFSDYIKKWQLHTHIWSLSELSLESRTDLH